MANNNKDVNEVMERAKRGVGGGVTMQDCLFLKRNMEPQLEYPPYCSYLLNSAKKTGLLSRRNSRVARAWDISDGHGDRHMRITEPVEGGALDNVNPAEAESFDDIFMKSRTPAQQEKIHKLHIRTASRGAKPRVNYEEFVSKTENQKAVVRETTKELTRRASRRSEAKMRKAQEAPLVA
ncbi:Uncharacterized protein SCF082_LOCUS19791 [Durusdinium trenchii]|uniref:Uncharacterized protein n=1 Tax=Durusdinium trenchii TaxID=1381693 RepID=A0ABP0KY45_9DINO